MTRGLARGVAPSWRLRLIPSPVPAARLSGCTTGAPSQVSILGSWSRAATLPMDADHPESQEVLVSEEVCLQFGIGCPSGAGGLWPPCLPVSCGDGPVLSWPALLRSFVL